MASTNDPRSAAVDGVVRILKRRVSGVDLWRAWDASQTADDPLPAGRTSIRLTPMAEPEEAVAACSGRVTFASPVLVRVEIRTPDPFRPDKALGLYSQIVDALVDPAERAARTAAGISWVEPVQPPDPTAAIDGSVAGGIRLVVHITRP
jgi:hypothetical protein